MNRRYDGYPLIGLQNFIGSKVARVPLLHGQTLHWPVSTNGIELRDSDQSVLCD